MKFSFSVQISTTYSRLRPIVRYVILETERENQKHDLPFTTTVYLHAAVIIVSNGGYLLLSLKIL